MPDRSRNIEMHSTPHDRAPGEAVHVMTNAEERRTCPGEMLEPCSPNQTPGVTNESVRYGRNCASSSHCVKKCPALPKMVVPVANRWYRCRRHLKHDIGRNALHEVYRHA